MTVLLDPTVISSAVATLCALHLLVKVVRKPDNRALRSVWLATHCFAAGLCLGLLNYGAESTRPVPDITRWTAITQHVLSMTGVYLGYSAYVWMAREHDDAARHVRRHGIGLVVALVTAVVPVVVASPEDYTAAHVADYGHAPLSSIYLAVFTGYIAVLVGCTGRLSWTWSRLADEPWIRRGLVVGTAGYALAAVYCAVRTTFIVRAVLGAPVGVKEGAVTGWLIAAAVPFMLVGITVPGWGPRLSAALRWGSMHRTHRRLHPLWLALTSANPHVRMSIGPSRLGEKWAVDNLPLRLHLRVVQIWDARRALLDHCDTADYDRALDDPRVRAKAPDVRAAFAEAAMLTAGLRRHRAGEPAPRRGPDALPALAGTADLAANVTWLRHVAAGFSG
ncbi:MAB_1171c family putative transporter [Lentzea sp. NPDC059081]|uniref:MAB_1171c family putative transporter n=1 Tax=Lentzea sp. NPDC059081 TaxID=3346719 RepID=UPI0036CCCA99